MGERTRNETSFRESYSKDGRFSPIIDKKTAERINKYCKATNQTRTNFVVRCINERLDELEYDYLQGLSKDELIKMIIRKAGNADAQDGGFGVSNDPCRLGC